MAKLTKTQLELLREGAGRSTGIVSFVVGHITSRRNGSYGHRKADAALALRDRGLLEWVVSHRSVHPMCHGFGSDVASEVVYRITEAGRRELINQQEKSK